MEILEFRRATAGLLNFLEKTYLADTRALPVQKLKVEQPQMRFRTRRKRKKNSACKKQQSVKLQVTKQQQQILCLVSKLKRTAQRLQQKPDGRAQTSEPPTAHHYCYCRRRIDCRVLSSHWKFLHNNSSESIR